MRNLRIQREEASTKLIKLFGPINCFWKIEGEDTLVIYHIGTDWAGIPVVYVPNKIGPIRIKLDMPNRLELQNKVNLDFNSIFPNIK